MGRSTITFLRACTSWRRLRPTSIARHVYETGLTAIPIVSLIAFLITVIIAYIAAQHMRDYGAEIFVVDLITIGVLRELGVLLTAIIVAGRSGSAFAAEIGAMKLNEEVDALHAIGVDPHEVLVLPRVIGLVIALPLLTVVADVVGLTGGALLCKLLLDMPLVLYHRARAGRHRAHHILGGHHQGAGVCAADRAGRHLSRPAGARLLARTRAPDYRGGGAVHIPRDVCRCVVRGGLLAAGHLMAEPLIEVRGLVNRFGAQVVHDGLDMTVEQGEVFGIVGGSGSGKSVLLRSILGLQRPQAGEVPHAGPRPHAAVGRRTQGASRPPTA